MEEKTMCTIQNRRSTGYMACITNTFMIVYLYRGSFIYVYCVLPRWYLPTIHETMTDRKNVPSERYKEVVYNKGRKELVYNKYTVVFVDYLMKWPEVFATSDQTSVTVVELLVEHIIPYLSSIIFNLFNHLTLPSFIKDTTEFINQLNK